VSVPIAHRILPRLARGVAVLALGLGALTACGGDSGSDADSSTAAASSSEAPASTSSSAPGSPSAAGPSAAAAQTVTATEADFSISLDQDALAAGDYEITVVNNGRATHDLVVEQGGNDVAGTDGIAPGASATLTVTLDAGEYVFYCSVGNHRAMGMELTVQVT
jgi:plastocyanin